MKSVLSTCFVCDSPTNWDPALGADPPLLGTIRRQNTKTEQKKVTYNNK